MVNDILNNIVLQSVFVGWLSAQLIKTLLHLLIYKKFDAERLIGAGGMPSSHSASVTALAATTGIQYGLDSFPFSISVVFAIIVMHDARGVRKEAGEHAKILNRMITTLRSQGHNPLTEINLKEFIGHTSLQVFVGAIIGILAAIIVNHFV